MDKDQYIRELRDVLMRSRVVLKELIEANPPEDVARELSIVDEVDRVLGAVGNAPAHRPARERNDEKQN